MSHKNLITLGTADGPVEFNLNAVKGNGKIAFIREVLFIQPQFSSDSRTVQEVTKILESQFVLGHWGRSRESRDLKREHLPEFRALPARIFQAMEQRELAFEDGLHIIRAMISAVESEFKSSQFWMEEGADQLILRREEIQMIRQTIEEVVIPALSENEYLARRLAELIIRTISRPVFAKFLSALPSS